MTAPGYAAQVKRIAGLDVVIRRGGELLASTLPGAAAKPLPPDQGEVEIGDKSTGCRRSTRRGSSESARATSVLQSKAGTSSDVNRSRLLAAVILAGFFVLAFAFAVVVSRSLQGQIAGFLDAARRLGAGDFSAKVPIHGPRRVRGAGRGVQQDVLAARGAAARAARPARAPRGRDAPHRRGVRVEPRPRRPAADRRARVGRRRGRRGRAGVDLRARRPAGGGADRRDRAAGARAHGGRARLGACRGPARRGGRRRPRPGRPAARGGRREPERRGRRRPRGRAVHELGARPLQLPRRPGGGVGGERRTCTRPSSARR